MTTKLQKTALRTHDRFYTYLEPQPFGWKSDYFGLEYTKSFSRLLPWILGQLVLALYPITCFYVVATHVWNNPRLHYNPLMIAIFILMGSVIWCIHTITIYCCLSGCSDVQAYNEMLNFERKLIDLKEIRSAERQIKVSENYSNQQRMSDIFLVAFVTILGTASFTIPIICLCIDYDAYYFALQDLLPDPEYQTVKQIISQVTVRLFLCTHVTTEILRLISFLVSIALMYFQTMTIIFNSLEHNNRDNMPPKQLIYLYTQFYLIFNVTQDRLNQVI